MNPPDSSEPDLLGAPHSVPNPIPAGPAAVELDAPPAVWRGNPYPLGATWDGAGVNFALFSERAEKVELCIFDRLGKREMRVELRERTDADSRGLSGRRRPARPRFHGRDFVRPAERPGRVARHPGPGRAPPSGGTSWLRPRPPSLVE